MSGDGLLFGAGWQASRFEIAYPTGPHMVSGYEYRGLGMHKVIEESPKGRRPPTWSLTHLGSGHRIVLLTGEGQTAFPVATEIAEAGAWDFLSLQGWKDRFPDAPDKVREIIEQHAKIATLSGGGPIPNGDAVARQIAANRP